MPSGGLSAEELPDEIRSLAELLAERLAERLGADVVRGTCRLELQFVNGRLQWLVPSPKIPASALGTPSSS